METNVLVVDDSAVIRKIIKDHLETCGYRVLVARDGEEALAIHRAIDIHVLITDLDTPRMNGLELCWHVRAEDDRHRSFSILMTSDADTRCRAEALDAGADEFLTKPIDLPMLRARVRAGERVTRTHRAMAEMLTTDGLTGVLNRRRFIERLEREYGHATETGAPLAVALFDLDRVKAINGTHGHGSGDRALTLFAESCGALLPDGGVLGRLGGGEFCMALPVGDVAEVIALAETVRRSTAALVATTADGGAFSFTVSVGVCLAQGTDSAADLLARAGESLALAKRGGRNRTVVCGTEGVVVRARFHVL
ncbi:GGDEF domain-containing response regulator [Azospirillum doebereinerae]